jgi:hypothetical protein
MKQTAIQYLVYEIFIVKRWMPLSEDELNDIFKQAEKMEKENTIDFANGWFRETLKSSKILTIEQYYNETFKSEK